MVPASYLSPNPFSLAEEGLFWKRHLVEINSLINCSAEVINGFWLSP